MAEDDLKELWLHPASLIWAASDLNHIRKMIPFDEPQRDGKEEKVLEDHIAKEDTILFAKAEEVLTSEDAEALLASMRSKTN